MRGTSRHRETLLLKMILQVINLKLLVIDEPFIPSIWQPADTKLLLPKFLHLYLFPVMTNKNYCQKAQLWNTNINPLIEGHGSGQLWTVGASKRVCIGVAVEVMLTFMWHFPRLGIL